MKSMFISLLALAGVAVSQGIEPMADPTMPIIKSGYTYGSGCPSGSVETRNEEGHAFPVITMNEFFLDTTNPDLRAAECTVVLVLGNFTAGQTVAFHSVNLEGYSAFEEGSWIDFLGVEVSVNNEVLGTAAIEEEWGRTRDINWKFTEILHFQGELPWNTCDITPVEEVMLSMKFSGRMAVVFNQDNSIPRGVLGMELGSDRSYALTIEMETEVETC